MKRKPASPRHDASPPGGASASRRPRTERRGFIIAMDGPAGVGKTSLAKGMPKTIMIDYDKGANQSGVKRKPGPKTWTEALALIRAIVADPRGYKTIEDFKGKLSMNNSKDPYAYKRAQYVDILLKSGEILKKYPIQ